MRTIAPTSPLPIITDPVTIDGYTQPGSAPNTNPGRPGSQRHLADRDRRRKRRACLIHMNGCVRGRASHQISPTQLLEQPRPRKRPLPVSRRPRDPHDSPQPPRQKAPQNNGSGPAAHASGSSTASRSSASSSASRSSARSGGEAVHRRATPRAADRRHAFPAACAARSTRMCRIASAATAKKCPSPSNARSPPEPIIRRYASCTSAVASRVCPGDSWASFCRASFRSSSYSSGSNLPAACGSPLLIDSSSLAASFIARFSARPPDW